MLSVFAFCAALVWMAASPAVKVEAADGITGVIFYDFDYDGIHDANEVGIAGVTLQLFADTDGDPNRLLVLIGGAITDSNGNYLFSSALSGTAGGAAYGLTQLLPGTAFEIRIPSAKYPAGTVPTATTTDASANGTSRDSNGVRGGTFGTSTAFVAAAGTLGTMPGANNHTIDFGFIAAAVASANNTVAGRVAGSKNRGFARVTVTLIDSKGVTRETRTNINGDFVFTEVPAGITIISASARGYRFTPSEIVQSITEDVTDLEFFASRNPLGGGGK